MAYLKLSHGCLPQKARLLIMLYRDKSLPTSLPSSSTPSPLPAHHSGLAVSLGAVLPQAWNLLFQLPRTHALSGLQKAKFYNSELNSNIIYSESFPNSPYKMLSHFVFFLSLITSGNHLILVYIIGRCSVSLTKI